MNGKKIMTDPGVFSTEQENETGIDMVLITHEHQDHIHMESLKKVLQNNPNTMVVTNSAVKELLDVENIPCVVHEEGSLENGIKLFAKTCPHADIYDGIGPVQNTGYMIENRLFYPGDAFLDPGLPVEILALPVSAPWCKIREVLEYGIKIKPKHAFPVHDAIINKTALGIFHGMTGRILAENGVDFKPLTEGQSLEF
jgi:L-ascorbate metabolism protein UlaG (beta-lactamase superfamily)